MIAEWMLGALMFTALCAVAAAAVESVCRVFRRPTRWPWVCALIVGAVWPLMAPFVLPPPAAESLALGGAVMGGAVVGDAGASMEPWWTVARAAAVSRWLVMAWGVATTVLVLQLLSAVRRLRRVHQHARRDVIDGEAVLVDEHLGPAVIGLVNPRIVLPSWLLGLDADLRSLVVQHEREHCRAGDSRLVWMAAAATTLLPWNLALWWVAHRLRTAMEIDCDRRTLHANVDTTLYAKLLLLIAQRNSSARFVPMLSPATSQLARRIHAMHSPIVRLRGLRASIATGIAVVAMAAACSSRIATNLTSPAPAVTTAVVEAPTEIPAGTPYFDFQVEAPATLVPGSTLPKYPEALRAQKISGTVMAQFVVNTDGVPEMATFKAVRSTDEAFTAAVREALGGMRFKPALIGGKAVRQLVQAPFAFALDGKAPGSPSAAPAAPSSSGTGDKQATLRPGSKGPQYPVELREAGIEGTVIVQFVVDQNGRVELPSLKVLKSDNEAFTAAVRAALADAVYDPAVVKGRAVKQLLQEPFQFSLRR